MTTDKGLQLAVERELLWEPSVHAGHIGVSVNNGIVQLDGHVNGYHEKWAAERATMRVANVKAVASELKVEVSSSDTRTDADIARAALNLLEWNFDAACGKARGGPAAGRNRPPALHRRESRL